MVLRVDPAGGIICPSMPRAVSPIVHPEDLVLGGAVPPGDPHAVSVQLPTWSDTVGWSEREPRVVDALRTGYPRFMVPRTVTSLSKKIAKRCLEGGGFKSQSIDELFVLPVSTYRHAALCQRSLRQKMETGVEPSDIAVMKVCWDGTVTRIDGQAKADTVDPGLGKEPIYAVTHPTELQMSARYFWQHTGFGISSRRSDFWLEQGPFREGEETSEVSASEEERAEVPAASYNANKDKVSFRAEEKVEVPTTTWYDSTEVSRAWVAMKRRIQAGNSAPEKNVYLYPGGMAAITETAMAIQSLRDPAGTSPVHAAVFGFLYVDTFKVLTNILGFHHTLYKYSDADVNQLEDRLRAGDKVDVVFTEFPGNPLLQCPDLGRLHKLSVQYKFLLVVDDTVGCYANVSLITSCDIICTSLTKMFSGGCNVMGGSTVISPHSPYADAIRAALQEGHEPEAWFAGDILVMEKNSRDFVERTRRASANAAAVADMLRADTLVEEVYYPKGSPTQHIYDQYKLPEGGYGFLMSIRFGSSTRAEAFYDALKTAKGPSLGTNFTLSCAYTILAHPHEIDWAASYGVVKELVRISIGLESEEWLKARVQAALDAAALVD